MQKADIGLIGLAVMGQNLVLNMESKGFTVAVHNRTATKTDEFVQKRTQNKNILPAYSLEELVERLKTPRKVMLMVKAGKPVDIFIEKLLEILEPGDIIIDGGNSLYSDSIRRAKTVEKRGLLYVGAGISGGEEGALNGPSIMPGGSFAAWEHIKSIFQTIAAQVDGKPCCEWIGTDGSGHYVKMVHNGIEYADMQLIGETYFLLKHLLKLNAKEMQDVFAEWNKGDLDSYLINITADILGKIDQQTGKPLLELVVDEAGQKGTGKWTSQESLDLGVAAPTIAEGVFARIISGAKEQRKIAAEVFPYIDAELDYDRKQIIDYLHQALFASKVAVYAQGFDLLKHASDEYGWSLNLGEIASLWRGGCIIRAQFLQYITQAYKENSRLQNLSVAPYFQNVLKQNEKGWREVVALAVKSGLPIPAFSSSLSYFDALRQPYLWTNLVQAQRDYFGAHGYGRIDQVGQFHTDWQKVGITTTSKKL